MMSFNGNYAINNKAKIVFFNVCTKKSCNNSRKDLSKQYYTATYSTNLFLNARILHHFPEKTKHQIEENGGASTTPATGTTQATS